MADNQDTVPQAADILVVDDTIASLQLLTEILSKAGYTVRPTDRPQVALESALAHPPRLILLDVRMPDMSGFEVCRRLKQDERTRDIPVIFVSALQDVGDRVQGFEVGGVDFVSKPFEESEVLARVKTHLQLREMQLHLEELVAARTAELVQSNEALRESEKRFRSTFEQAAVGIAHVALDGRFLRLNQRFCDIVGYSPDEMLARTFQDITHPDDLKTDLEYVQQLLVGEAETYAMEKRYFRQDGQIVWVNLTVSLLRKATGEPEYFISVVEDITERKRMEGALRESEERYRTLVEQAQDGIVVLQDGKIRFTNSYLAAMSGRTVEELLNTTFEDYLTADQLPKVVGIYRRRMNNEAVPSVYESAIQHKDGSRVEVEFNASLTTYDGRGADMVMVRDITVRKQAEEALRDSEERFRNLMEQSPVSIQIHSPEGRLMQSNAAYARLYALNEETLAELYDKYNVLQDEQAKRIGVMPFIKKAFAGEEVVFPPYEYDGIDTLKTLDFDNPISRRCWVRTHGFPLKGIDGRVTNVVFMSEDITQRVQTEREILEYQLRLKALASELTLAEERERRRIAAELHDEVGQTLALARIQLASALKVTSDAKVTAILDDTSASLRQAIQDTRDLVFDLSSPLLNEIGLAAATSEWLEAQIANKHGLQTEFIESGQDMVLGDDMRAILFRNVRELLTNVVRHAGASKVSVRLKHVGDMAIVVIQDDGIGFDPLAVSELTDRSGGFGLFSIQERMADLGGTLEIVSEPGQGCKATLTAPLKSRDDER